MGSADGDGGVLQRSRWVQQPRTTPAFVPFLKGSTPWPLGKTGAALTHMPGLGLDTVALVCDLHRDLGQVPSFLWSSASPAVQEFRCYELNILPTLTSSVSVEGELMGGDTGSKGMLGSTVTVSLRLSSPAMRGEVFPDLVSASCLVVE